MKLEQILAVKELEFKLIKSERKTISLFVKQDCSVVVRAPLRCTNSYIEQFVEEKMGWIRNKLNGLKDFPYRKRDYSEGKTLPFLGEELTIRYWDKERIEKIEEDIYLPFSAKDLLPSLLKIWYRNQAQDIILKRALNVAIKNGFHPSSIKITGAESRWGSCSGKGAICLSWRLVMTPSMVIDYVIFHELVHLLVRNHSQVFWNRLADFYPNYQLRREWLRANELNLRLH